MEKRIQRTWTFVKSCVNIMAMIFCLPMVMTALLLAFVAGEAHRGVWGFGVCGGKWTPALALMFFLKKVDGLGTVYVGETMRALLR